MDTIVEEIGRAIESLALPSASIRKLPNDASERVYRSAQNHFVASGDRRRWWEAFRETGLSHEFGGGDGWRQIVNIAPNPDESVWFIAEDEQLPLYPVFDTTPKIASDIIGECYAFEYFLVAKDLSWLICETHHNVMWAIGSAVEQRLRDVVSNLSLS